MSNGIEELLFTEDAWLSNILRYPCYRMSLRRIGEIGWNETERIAYLHFGATSGRKFYYCKLMYANLEGPGVVSYFRDKIEDLGFNIVNINNIYSIDLRAKNFTDVPCSCREINYSSKKEGDAIMWIAEKSFLYDRFHADANLINDADRIKEEWARSYFRRLRGDAIYVSVSGDIITGFLAAMSGKYGCLNFSLPKSGRVVSDVAIIDLIAVAPAFRGNGIGKSLVQKFISEYFYRFNVAVVSTSMNNLFSNQMYKGIGFRICGHSLDYHLTMGC